MQRRKGRDVTINRGAGEAGCSVVTHHQHKHTEEEGREKKMREKGEEEGVL